MKISFKASVLSLVLVLLMVVVVANVAYGFKVRENRNNLAAKEFRAEELYIPMADTAIAQLINQLPNRADWQQFMSTHSYSTVYFDARSGRPTTLTAVIPLIPGTGDGNKVTMADVSARLGYQVKEINADVMKQLVLSVISEYAGILGVKTSELGAIRVQPTTDWYWNVIVRREVNGIPVRDALMSFVISHGNIMLWGVEKWGDINVSTVPKLTKEAALNNGFAQIGGRTSSDTFSVKPHLELVPVNPSSYAGAVGTGYTYRLVWAYVFGREGYRNNWEVLVDAHSGQVLAMQDTNQYALKKIVGTIYPLSNDECPPDGIGIPNTGFPFANTGLAAPNNYTDINGIYNWTSGNITTTLDSRYITSGTDTCGVISESATNGDLDLGGTTGQHDCTVPAGKSVGDTFSTRSAAYELTQINREARGWVNIAWLDCSGVACITANVNLNSTCNAYYTANSVNFYRSGGGCRNTGETAAVFDHEWGHGFDAYDAAGVSNPGEVMADILSTIRLHASCVGRGFFWTLSRGCGLWTCPGNAASTGYNNSGYGDCSIGCTGIRESDYAKHASGNPHTPANFICALCGAGAGPCGKEVHCENAPAAEAAWDLPARDLQTAPFNMDRQTAFTIADKATYVGSNGTVGFYTCTCPSTSGGCTATNAYMQWAAADDDDGNLNNGAPHMTAVYNAFNRHAIACAAPTPQNSGCAGAPTTAPVLTATPVSMGANLSWTSVPGAATYRVYKSISTLGCDTGKILLATTTALSYVDAALDCNMNNYMVEGVGSNAACLGPDSNCAQITPPYPAPSNLTVTASAPNQVTASWTAVAGATGYNLYRQYTVCSVVTTEKIASNILPTVTSYIDSPVSGGLLYQYQIATITGSCGEGSKSNWVPVTPTGNCALSPCFAGAISVADNKTASCGLTVTWGTGTSSCSAFPTIKYDVYKSTDPAFVPGPSNLLVSCQTGTSYVDANVNYGTTYYYVVRAEDNRTGGSGPCNGGDIDSNLVKKSGNPTGVPIPGTFSDNMESGTNGWTVSSGALWHLYAPGTCVPPGYHSATHSWYYGQDATCNYDTGVTNTGTLTAPAINGVSATSNLTFWFFRQVEAGPAGYDVSAAQVSSDSGSTWTSVWSEDAAVTSENAWTASPTVSLSAYAGLNILLRFSFNTTDALYNTYQGLAIDDVTVTNIQTPTACTTGSQPPGNVLNNLKVTKTSGNPVLNWNAVTGTCTVTGYGIYRGTLPWTAFNHASINCATTGTTYTDSAATNSYYYLVVPYNTSSEGSYGTQFPSGTQRPQGSSPCKTQSLTVCN